jgi:excisionase family DNA binding protein
MTETLLTAQQVADRLQVSVDFVQEHATRRSPRIKTVRLGKLLRFRPQDIEEFIQGQLMQEHYA